MEDRCECGQRYRCPRDGEAVMANRSGVPFTVMRQMDEGECFLTIRHINDGEEGLPIRCSDPDAEDEMALRQLHMQGPKPIN